VPNDLENDPSFLAFASLLAIIRRLNGPSEEVMQSYLEGRDPQASASMQVALRQLVAYGALEKKADRYFVTPLGDTFLRDHLPSPAVQIEFIQETLMMLQRNDGSTIEELVKHFRTGQNDAIFRGLIARFVELGLLDLRDGRYYVNDDAREEYQVSRIN